MKARNGSTRAVLGAMACLAFSGCANTDVEALRAFLQKPRSPVAGTEYRVMPPDVISITSRHVPEINGSQQVRPDGKINLPLVSEIFIANKTPKEIEEALTKAAKDYYEQVDATVVVTGYNSQKFYVFGQVSGPGPQPWTGNDTLLDVLAKVQPTELAWPERIKLVRAAQPSRGGYEPDTGKDKGTTTRPVSKNEVGADEMEIDLMVMIKTGDLSRNVLLRPDDVIYVPPHPFAALGLALRQVLFPVYPVLEAVRVPRTVANATSAGQ